MTSSPQCQHLPIALYLLSHPDPRLPYSDSEYFGKISKPALHADNWALRFNSLKRLFRLMNQYYTDVLRQPTTAIDVPNLQSIAQDYNLDETLLLCRLAIAIAVQSGENGSVIERIQNLNGDDQHVLMKAIELVRPVRTTSTVLHAHQRFTGHAKVSTIASAYRRTHD